MNPFKYLLKIFGRLCPLTGISPMGKTNHKETCLYSEKFLLVVGGRETALVQMTTVPKLLGHAFTEVYCEMCVFGGKEGGRDRSWKICVKHKQHANVKRVGNCSLETFFNFPLVWMSFFSQWKTHRDWNSDFLSIEAMPTRIPRLANSYTLLSIVTNKRNSEYVRHLVYKVSLVRGQESLSSAWLSFGQRRGLSSSSPLPAGSWSHASLGHLLTTWKSWLVLCLAGVLSHISFKGHSASLTTWPPFLPLHSHSLTVYLHE